MGRGPKPAKPKVAAKPPVSRKSPENDGARFRDLEKRLAEALRDKTQAQEQQTATAEILRVISSSQTDVQPVFDAIANRVVPLCDAYFSTVWRYDGTLIHHAADNYPTEEMRAVLTKGYPAPPQPGSVVAQAISEGRIIHVEDLLNEAAPAASRAVAIALGYRTLLSVPMLRDGESIGAIAVARREQQPFSDRQIELVKTFADQAVMAIENVRLFNELQEKNQALTTAHAQVGESLEQQTATSDILRVIASSLTDVQPVFETIARSATTLCEADLSGLYPFDGVLIHFAAEHGRTPAETAAARRAFPQPPSRLSVTARAILTAAVVQVADVSEEPEVADSLRMFRTVLSVPMLRDGRPLGAITIARRVVRPFTDKQIELLQTFADQAVIAIENVRLFKELQTSNRELTDALEQQTATSQILAVISGSPTDVQPVFQTIATNAARLCAANDAMIFRREGDVLRLVARWGSVPMVMTLESGLPITRDTVAGRAVTDAQVLHIPDVQAVLDEFTGAKRYMGQSGIRTALAAPLLREGAALGLILIRRLEVKPFTEKQIELLRTFADQAVIAIENVRLFTELQEKNQALTQAHAQVSEALEQQTATADILRVISSSPTDAQPVFDTIVRNAVRLCGAIHGGMYTFDGELIHARANEGYTPEQLAHWRSTFPRPLTSASVVSKAIRNNSVVLVEDLETAPDFEVSRETWANLRARGSRSLLAVPMSRHNTVIGAVALAHGRVGAFSATHVELLKTFADQAVIAIENVRLFKELEAANRELAAASQHKSEFLANMSHELRTPLNAIIGFSEVLSEKMFGNLNEKQEEYSKDIHASGQHLLSLINDILDLSKIEAGQMELAVTDFHLPTALDSALTLVRERAGRRGIALHLSGDERLGQVRADERKVRQVVLNLLSNAIKFTPEGGRIEVAAVAKDGMVEVSVSDTGVGIAPEDQEAVFEEFRQVGTADKKVEGTGLGLTLCRKFVELHGGKIWVRSELGKGSTFTFTIPMRQGE